MNTFRLLRFLLPMQNPFGFGLGDFLAFGVGALMLGAILARRQIEAMLRWVAVRPWRAMALLALLPIVLRLLLLPLHPLPAPSVSDDFSYLLLGDTLAHFRLANAIHPMHRFFETVFVLQEPSYSSIYPAGQGMVLAFGELLFHCPWAGVAISVGIMCALCYWMLRGWVSPEWAVVGGLLAVMEFGPLNQWMNNYWGGAVSASAGCLAFGAAPRLWKRARARDAVLLGLSLGLQMVTRPFEATLLLLCVSPIFWRSGRRMAGVVLLVAMPFAGLTLAQNKAVTGRWLTLPYMLSRAQYGIPATFTFQNMTEPERELTQEQRVDYEAQKDVHDSAGNYFVRLAQRIRFLRFFLLPPLYVALVVGMWPDRRTRRPAIGIGITGILVFWLGTNIYPYFYPHYIAAVTCLFLLLAVLGLARMRPDVARVIVILCVAHFAFWYGIHLFGTKELFEATGAYESWDYINYGDAEGRIAIDGQLSSAPGKQLVFVHYGPRHLLREWVHNAADIDGSGVVWALDLGPDEDRKLRQYYPDRKVWMVEPDAIPPKLSYLPAQ